MSGVSRLLYRVFYCETTPFKKEINIFERRDIVEYICEGVVEPYTKKDHTPTVLIKEVK